MNTTHLICQACGKALATRTIENEVKGRPYQLCGPCSDRLEKRALRPLEWYNLAAIHGWAQYDLHDDFYDEDGIASQPESDFPVPREPRSPRLDEVAHDLDRLIGHCLTRWHLGDAEFDALKRFDAREVLARVTVLGSLPSAFHWSRALELAANVLQRRAERFVAEQYDRAREIDGLYVWAEAAAECLPESDGLPRAIAALEALPPRKLYDNLGALTWFRSKTVLDWIERRVPDIHVGENWGRLAAHSSFTWDIAQDWLARGRPLSLVALDALTLFVPRGAERPDYAARAPRLANCPSTEVMRLALERYRAADDAPKATRLCSFIIANLNVLRVQ